MKHNVHIFHYWNDNVSLSKKKQINFTNMWKCNSLSFHLLSLMFNFRIDVVPGAGIKMGNGIWKILGTGL